MKSRIADVNGRTVHFREANDDDVALMKNFYMRLPEPRSVSGRGFPLRGADVEEIRRRSWAVRPCLVAVVSGKIVAVGAVQGVGDRAEIKLWSDSEWAGTGLPRTLAEALVQCARGEGTDGAPYRRLITRDPVIASTPGFRRVHKDLSELRPVPWRPWGDVGAEAAQTLLMARFHSRGRALMVKHIVAALDHADGCELEPILRADDSDPFGGALAGEQLVVRIGPTVLPFRRAVDLMRGRPTILRCSDRRTVQAAAERLARARVIFADVIVTSYDPEALRAAVSRGLRTGLLVGGRQRLPSEAVLGRLLDRSGADFAVVPWNLYRMGVLERCGNRPALVGPVSRVQQVQQAAQDHAVHAVLIGRHPKRARTVLEQLARAAGA